MGDSLSYLDNLLEASNFSYSLFAAQSTEVGTEYTVISINGCLFSQFSRPVDDKLHFCLGLYVAGCFFRKG